MNRKTLSILSLAIAALAAGNALAADAAAGKPRDQVRAELADAQRTGDIVLAGSNSELKGLKLNEINPSQYPTMMEVQGKTRAQVVAELAEAQRTGDIVLAGNNAEFKGQKLNEIDPGQYPVKPVQVNKTRAQVLAELQEAQRTGNIYVHVGSKHVKANDVDAQSYN